MNLANNYLSTHDIDFANLVEFESKDFKLAENYVGITSDQTACPKDVTQLVYNSARWEPSSSSSDRATGCLAKGDRPFVLQAFKPKDTKSSQGIDGIIVIGAHFPHPAQLPFPVPVSMLSSSSSASESAAVPTSEESSFYSSSSSSAAAAEAANQRFSRQDRAAVHLKKRKSTLEVVSDALAIDALLQLRDEDPREEEFLENSNDISASGSTSQLGKSLPNSQEFPISDGKSPLESPENLPPSDAAALLDSLAAASTSSSSSQQFLEALKAALANVVKSSGIQQVLLIADTNEYDTTSSADIAADLSFPGNKVIGTTLSRTCCEDVSFPPQFTFDRIIANFGSASEMETQVLLDDPLPSWTHQEKAGRIGAFHKPILGVLRVEPGGGLGPGALAAIICGLLLAFGIVLWLAWRAHHRRRQPGRDAPVAECGAEAPARGSQAAVPEQV